MSDNLAVAQEILRQLGGRKFIAMTGCKDFVGRSDSLQFKFRNSRNDYKAIRITLTPMDVYKIEFFKWDKITDANASEPVETIDDVYCDNLVEIFEKYTGLATSL